MISVEYAGLKDAVTCRQATIIEHGKCSVTCHIETFQQCIYGLWVTWWAVVPGLIPGLGMSLCGASPHVCINSLRVLRRPPPPKACQVNRLL